MAPKCSICIHAKRTDIDRMLLDGSASLRDIAGQFQLSRSALSRHRGDHLPARMAKAAARREDADLRTAIDVTAQLKAINGVSLSVLKEAREAKDGSLALQAIDRVHKQIELQAKLIDLIRDGDTVNIIVNPQWLQLRTTILSALSSHPEARSALVEALSAVEGNKGHDRVA